MNSLSDCHLYGILDLGYVASDQAVPMAGRMLAGGVEILQLRAKSATKEETLDLAKQIAPLCKSHGVPFILNDHPDLVLPANADGVHVGQDDIPVDEVRSIIGNDRIIGLSTHSLSQATRAAALGPHYIGFGPLFATPTKPDYAPIGVADIEEVHRKVSLPVFCIGGIKLDNLPSVLTAGARRVVIVSGILLAANVEGYCADCRRLL